MADGAADDHRLDTVATVRTKPLKSNAGTVADDADANGDRRSGAAELPPGLNDAADHNVRPMLAARVFFLAYVFNMRTSAVVHARRFDFLAI
jgi:hypothetical protein